MKPTIYISSMATDQTNQANVAQKLFNHISDEAGREVWNAPLTGWIAVAQKYVNIETWDMFGTKFEAVKTHMPLSPLTDYSPVPASEHRMFPSRPISEGGNALQKIKRFLGFGNGS